MEPEMYEHWFLIGTGLGLICTAFLAKSIAYRMASIQGRPLNPEMRPVRRALFLVGILALLMGLFELVHQMH
jgi:hypothetical protein